MRAVAVSFAIAVLAALSSTTPAADDDVAKAREFFDGGPDDGPSLTRRVHDFLALDPALISRTESEAWELSGHDFFRVERTLRFLHGMDYPIAVDRWDVIGGAVVRRALGDYSGPGDLDRTAVSYDKTFADVPRQRMSLPAAAEMLAVLRNRRWELHNSVADDFGEALGEACADDDDGFAELLRREDANQRESDRDPILATALGWSRRPVAVERLLRRARAFTYETPYINPAEVHRTLRALRHADAATFARFIEERPTAEGDTLISCVDQDLLLARQLAALDAADSPERRKAVLARVCHVGWPLGEHPPSGDRAARLFAALLEGMDSGDFPLCRDARTAACCYRYGESHVQSSIDLELRALVDDLRAGRFRLLAKPQSLWSRKPLVATVEGFAKPLGYTDATTPIAIAGTWTDRGLRVRLQNNGRSALALNATALRQVDAYRINDDGDRDLEGKTLRVQLGMGRNESPAPVYDAAALVMVPPGGEHGFLLPLSPDARSARHVRLEMPWPAVEGASSAPVIWFDAIEIL